MKSDSKKYYTILNDINDMEKYYAFNEQYYCAQLIMEVLIVDHCKNVTHYCCRRCYKIVTRFCNNCQM